MEPRQQRIMDAVADRMRTILKSNGYRTNIGEYVIVDRPQVVDPEGNIGPAPVEPSEMPCLLIRDPTNEIREESTETHRHRLTIELEIRTQGILADKDARLAVADVLKATGIDTTWGGLADRTSLQAPAAEKVSLQGNITFAAAIIRIAVEYETAAWQSE